jgi:integrase
LPYAKTHKRSCFNGYRTACQALLRYADLTTAEFDACLLLEIQAGFVRYGYYRVTCNEYTNRIIHVFRWGETRRLVPPGKYVELKAIDPVPVGAAPDGEERQDVPDDVVERTLPYLLPMYQALVRILQATGARPIEILRLKVGEIDKKDPERWVFCPKNHKTAKKNKRRIIVFGRKEQEILAPYMAKKSPESVIFSPKTVTLEHYNIMHSKRKKPMNPARVKERERNNNKFANITEQFRTASIPASALKRAIDKANRELPSDQQIPQWTLYQLRHSFCTRAVLQLGEEAAALMMGLSDLSQIRERYDHSEKQRATEFKKRLDEAENGNETTTPEK